MKIPDNHPRKESLRLRDKIVSQLGKLVTTEGLIAHGRGEAFDYIIGEKTIKAALLSEAVGASMLKTAKKPVISVNGNTAALVAEDIVKLSKVLDAHIEVNLFYRTEERAQRIKEYLESFGAENVGIGQVPKIPGLTSERAKVSDEALNGDVWLVPLEDGDRTEALVKSGKSVIAIDLNPFSRTSIWATVSIVDNVVRALPNLIKFSKFVNHEKAKKLINSFDNSANLERVIGYIEQRLKKISEEGFYEILSR